MPIIQNKDEFIKQLKSFLGDNCVEECISNMVVIEEKEIGGQGKIELDFSYKIKANHFLIKIKHESIKGCGCGGIASKRCDSIILYVDIAGKKIETFICELKTSVTSSSLKKALYQIYSGLTVLDSFGFIRCKFKVKNHIIIGYKNDSIASIGNKSTASDNPLFQRPTAKWSLNHKRIRVINLFCGFSLMAFIKVEFDTTLTL